MPCESCPLSVSLSHRSQGKFPLRWQERGSAEGVLVENQYKRRGKVAHGFCKSNLQIPLRWEWLRTEKRVEHSLVA